MKRKASLNVRVERDQAVLLERLPAILEISNRERDALGFLPEGAYLDAIQQRRLHAVVQVEAPNSVAGFILFGGVFPHARVQQIGVAPAFRRSGIGSTLMNCLVSDLEKHGYLTLKAAIAADLPVALEFYRKNGFEQALERPGGRSRERRILVHVRQLDTASLFSDAHADAVQSRPLTLNLTKPPSEAPFYTLDLNVLFDLTRDRGRSADARRLFGAALTHRIRVAVAPEFIAELERTTSNRHLDPILQMALQLPRLPPARPQDLEPIAKRVHQIVFSGFGLKNAESPQSWSDARHVAHAALSKASGYITADSALLSARRELLDEAGIDVATCEELMSLIPRAEGLHFEPILSGEGFRCVHPASSDAIDYLRMHQVSFDENQFGGGALHEKRLHWAIVRDDEMRAVASLRLGPDIQSPAQLLIHVAPDNLNAEVFADFLLDTAIRAACTDNPAVIELGPLSGQAVVKSAAAARGFMRGPHGRLVKLAMGRPLTRHNWSAMMDRLRRRTGVRFPTQFPEGLAEDSSLVGSDPSGANFRLTLGSLEKLLDPTLVIWGGRGGVIVPIHREFADELLGTAAQMNLSLVESRQASFLSQRVYVNTPRASGKMLPGSPILFYESSPGRGRSAIVAAARIVDSLVTKKDEVPTDRARRIVTEDVEQFSETTDVLITAFEGIMVFPRPYTFRMLWRLNAVGNQNLITATIVEEQKLSNILDEAWAI